MKKLLLIIAIVVLFISCSNEDKNNCNCKRAKMTLFEPNAGYFYINNLPINCETGEPDYSELPDNYIFVNCEN
jgi:hypothetical protein